MMTTPIFDPDRLRALLHPPQQGLRHTGREHWYHVTCIDMGMQKTLHPRTSKQSLARPSNEPTLARVCVGPDPAYCLAAINYDPRIPYHVYRTEQQVVAVYPYDVADAVVTREKWLLESTAFVRIATFDADLMGLLPINVGCGLGDAFSANVQRGRLRAIRQVLTHHGFPY